MHFFSLHVYFCVVSLSLHLISYSLLLSSQDGSLFLLFFYLLFCPMTGHCDWLALPCTKWGKEKERSGIGEIASGGYIRTRFPVSFNHCIVLSKVCQWSVSLQFLQRMLLTLPPLFSCHFSLPSNHFHFL